MPFDLVYDVRGVRVIVADEPTCYMALGFIHSTWRPVPGEFDDYIGNPKDNFYKSLHTAVIWDDGKTLEIQIRTPKCTKTPNMASPPIGGIRKALPEILNTSGGLSGCAPDGVAPGR